MRGLRIPRRRLGDDRIMTEIVLMSDPRVAAVPVAENHEPLSDLRAQDTLLVDGRRADEAGTFALVRKGLRERLLAAARRLPDGYRVLFVEGYRPPAVQRAYFERYTEQVRALHPDWPTAQLREAASRYVSPPEIAPHSAGAAVDLTLVDEAGEEVDMGTRINATPEESENTCYTDALDITPEARANRRLLGDALVAAGLVNYPTEWWHWSYGDRYWALQSGAPAALYGPVDPD